MSIIVKNKKQIAGIRKSCKLAAATLDYIEPYVVEGVTTEYLDSLICQFIYKNSATPACLNYKGFPKSCCISVNETICHGVPNQYTLKQGDILNIDVTTILHGYYGDTGRMYMIPSISEDAQKILNVARRCLEIGIEQVRPGNYFGNIGYEIGIYCALQGCSIVTSFCGHGVGLEFHEPPELVHFAEEKDSENIMKVGNIFTVEPMICTKSPNPIILEDGWSAITEDGGLSAQYEETLLVTDYGYEILTR